MAAFDTLVDIMREVCPDDADRAVERIVAQLGGVHVRVPAKPRKRVTERDIRQALHRNGWNVDKAAAELDVHRSTIYRAMKPKRTIQPPERRLVR